PPCSLGAGVTMARRRSIQYTAPTKYPNTSRLLCTVKYTSELVSKVRPNPPASTMTSRHHSAGCRQIALPGNASSADTGHLHSSGRRGYTACATGMAEGEEEGDHHRWSPSPVNWPNPLRIVE